MNLNQLKSMFWLIYVTIEYLQENLQKILNLILIYEKVI